jgi:hypothetical protein
MDWPLREMLLALVAQMQERARQMYDRDVLVWAMLAPYQKGRSKPPSLPEILRG